MKKLLLIFTLLFSVNAIAFPQFPVTTGHICSTTDKDFKEFRYKTKMPYCKRNVNQSMRKKIYAKYGIKWEERSHYTIDHIVPLSIGGSNHYDNLWPEHLSIKCSRGNLEFKLYYEVNEGIKTHTDAQMIILKSKLGLK